MKSWKTTIGGFLAATGLAMQASDNAQVKLAGYIIAAIGTLIVGTAAQDNIKL